MKITSPPYNSIPGLPPTDDLRLRLLQDRAYGSGTHNMFLDIRGEIDKAQAVHPGEVAISSAKAAILIRLANYEEAAKLYEAHSKKRSLKFRENFEFAVACWLRNETAKAKKIIKAALSNDLEAFNMIFGSLNRMMDLEYLLPRIEVLLLARANDPYVLRLMGDIWFMEQDWKQAEVYLQRAFRYLPQEVKDLEGEVIESKITICLYQQDKKLEAARRDRRLRNKRDKDRKALLETFLAKVNLQSRYPGEVEDSTHLAMNYATEEGTVREHMVRAEVDMVAGRYTEAINEVTLTLGEYFPPATTPDREMAVMLLQVRAMIHHTYGHYEQAINDYTLAIELQCEGNSKAPDPKSLAARGKVYFAAGKIEEAAHDLAEAGQHSDPLVVAELLRKHPEYEDHRRKGKLRQWVHDPENQVKIPLIKKFKHECERRKLPEDEIISRRTLYTIGKTIGIDVPGNFSEFRSGQPAYHRLRKMASELHYRQEGSMTRRGHL